MSTVQVVLKESLEKKSGKMAVHWTLEGRTEAEQEKSLARLNKIAHRAARLRASLTPRKGKARNFTARGMFGTVFNKR